MFFKIDRKTIFDELKGLSLPPHLMPIGRLDYNSEGLLLLTNNGDYSRILENPSNQIPRRYLVEIKGRNGILYPKWLKDISYHGITVDNIQYN